MAQAGTLVQKREDAGMILEHHWPDSQKLIGLLLASIAHTYGERRERGGQGNHIAHRGLAYPEMRESYRGCLQKAIMLGTHFRFLPITFTV